MKRLVLIGLFFVLAACGEVKQPPGEIAPFEPMQESLSDVEPFNSGQYTIQPLARFGIQARVLSKRRYSRGHEGKLSPVDLALGWGPMSDSTVLEEIKIRQANRWYYWRVKEFPIPRREIEINSANMHMLPAGPAVNKQLRKTRKGNVIELTGHLVRVQGPDGWHWQSSMTREDTGNHACEVIWVETFKIVR